MSALLKNYARKKISFKKGKGCYLYSTKGVKYLDFVQGIAVNSLGHCNDSLVRAINRQSKKLWHVSNAFIIMYFLALILSFVSVLVFIIL